MRYLAIASLLLMFQSGFAAAVDHNAELESLYTALNMLNQQQQAIYQQFQMVQDLRRGAIPLYGTPLPQYVGPPANYDEAIAAQKNALRRDEDLSQQADQLLDKYNEIEELKRPIQQRIYSLTLGK